MMEATSNTNSFPPVSAGSGDIRLREVRHDLVLYEPVYEPEPMSTVNTSPVTSK